MSLYCKRTGSTCTCMLLGKQERAHRVVQLRYLHMYLYPCRTSCPKSSTFFSPIFQYFSAVNVTRVSFSQIFQYFLTCMPCAICHGFVGRGFVRRGFVGRGFVGRGFVGRGFVRRGFVRRGFVRRGIVQRGFVRQGIVHPPEKLHFAKEKKGIETVALVRVQNKERLDSLGADLQLEKEQGRVADLRLPRKGNG